jgi:hypothetical protein
MTPPEITPPQSDLIAALQSADSALQELVRHHFGRKLEFVFIVWDRGLADSTGNMPIAYQTFSYSEKDEALKVAHGTLTEALKNHQKSLTNLH